MSTAKRSRRRHTEASAASPPPASKRLKTTNASHVPAPSGLGFLVDDNAKSKTSLNARLTNGVPSSKTTRVDESRAVVAADSKARQDEDSVNGEKHEVISISSREEDSEDSDEDSDDEPEEALVEKVTPKPTTNGLPPLNGDGQEEDEQAVTGADDVEMAEAEIEPENDDDEQEEPSFGEMLQARHPETIDVTASYPNPFADRQALVGANGSRALSIPSGTSLGTVLTQALKTNDKDLLETCFHTHDLPSIRNTIQRLQSQHVATLLQRLAERIHKRPGRTGTLLVWVQWSLIAHGGYLATQPELMKKLRSLSQVIRERASGLQPLLHLKGKLDMLSAQLEVRRSMQAANRAANAEDDDDEEGVVYVEGQDEDWSEDDEEEAQPDSQILKAAIVDLKTQTAASKPNGRILAEDSESDGDMPNGVMQELDDDEDEEDEAAEGILDIEAEETSDDESDEEENSEDEASDVFESMDDDDEENESDEDSAADIVQPPKPATLNRKR